MKQLAFSQAVQPSGTGQIDTTKYPEVGKFLDTPYEHVVAQCDRHVLGTNRPDQLIERLGYVNFKGAILERMKRDRVLGTFLVGALAK